VAKDRGKKKKEKKEDIGGIEPIGRRWALLLATMPESGILEGVF
jgi:hypothetical protein